MEDYLRLGLLALALILVCLIVFESWIRHRRMKAFENHGSAEEPNKVLGLADAILPQKQNAKPQIKKSTPKRLNAPALAENPIDDFIVIHVFAKPFRLFASYDLLQAITGSGLHFGERNIFHYYESSELIFSLASATKPGTFDLNRIGGFTCKGLSLFLRLQEQRDAQHAFELMLKTADHLVDILDGEMRASPEVLWNDDVLLQYQQKVTQFEMMNEA